VNLCNYFVDNIDAKQAKDISHKTLYKDSSGRNHWPKYRAWWENIWMKVKFWNIEEKLKIQIFSWYENHVQFL